MKFNLSYSALCLWESSELIFFLSKILKAPPSDEVIQCYGVSGNCVHFHLENYAKDIKLDFRKSWQDKGLNSMRGFQGEPLSCPIYQRCAKRGEAIIDLYKQLGFNIIVEERIEIPIEPGINLSGEIDFQAVNDKGERRCLDYKTNNTYKKGEFRKQQLFYAVLIYRKKGYLVDKYIWHHLKTGQKDSVTFALQEVLDFEQYLLSVIEKIKQKGMDINNYAIGDISSPFNIYKSLILNQNKLKITLQEGRIFLQDPPQDLIQLLAEHFSYELKNSFFIKRAMGKKGFQTDAIRRFYKISNNSLPLGFLNNLTNLLEVKGIKFVIEDKRVKLRDYEMPNKLVGVELRPHQINAVSHIMTKKICFAQIITSGGKTVIAAEVIRENRGLTLFVVDRNILLSQVKKEFEKIFNQEIGLITDGKVDIKPISIATIQTLDSMVKRKDGFIIQYLKNLKTLIIDEGHCAGANSYMRVAKYIHNATIRMGMSSNYEREDSNEMMIESVVGYNSFIIKANELEGEFIMKPDIYFFKYQDYIIANIYGARLNDGDFHEMYDREIVNNPNRNNLILSLVNKYKNKNILILVNKIKHGEYLQQQIPNSFFIKGSVDHKTRDEIIEKMKDDTQKVIIGTASIMMKGVNIVNLDIMINTCGNASSIMSIQSLGRVLRKNKGKERAIYIDFFDDTNEQLIAHTYKRINTLKSEGHKVKIMVSKNGQ